MLSLFFTDEITLGLAQAAISMVLALVVVALARMQEIHLEKETAVALIRGLVQVVIVGVLLVLLLQGPGFTSAIVLLLMTGAAASISARRARGIPGALKVSLYGIAAGSAAVIIPMTWLGVIDPEISSLVPVGSMLIANAMNSNALALDRFRGEVESHVGQIEAGLSLGAEPGKVVLPYVRASVHASLIPRVDTLRSLGIVWIPGLMAGMIIAGANPIYAAIYQFVVIAMIYAASGITSLVSTMLIRGHAFSEAQQLTLRPVKSGGSRNKQ
jgi:putative ABC transport system permease protein